MILLRSRCVKGVILNVFKAGINAVSFLPGPAAALQADKTKKSFWQKVNNKNRSPSLPTLVGGANGGSEIVKMWKDYFKGILNSENSGNGSAEFVEHSIDCKDNYLGIEMPMCSFVSLASLLQKLPFNKAPGPDCISAEHLLYADESLRFFSVTVQHVYCSRVYTQFLFKHNNSSPMQKQEWEYV